jgi:hypothetical protein
MTEVVIFDFKFPSLNGSKKKFLVSYLVSLGFFDQRYFFCDFQRRYRKDTKSTYLILSYLILSYLILSYLSGKIGRTEFLGVSEDTRVGGLGRLLYKL